MDRKDEFSLAVFEWLTLGTLALAIALIVDIAIVAAFGVECSILP